MFDMSTPEWFKKLHGPEYTAYVQAALRPTRCVAEALAARRSALWATPIVSEIVSTQRPNGGWDIDSPELWYKSLPRMLEALVDYGFTLLDEPLSRGVRYLLSLQRPDGSFALEDPAGIPYDEAYNSGCIRVLVAAGLRTDPVVRRAAERLLAARRHDGGWSTLPPWMRQSDLPLPDPEPSCPICTDLAVGALGAAVDLDEDLRDKFLAEHLTVVDDFSPPARAAQWRERLEFMANQGMTVGDRRVDQAVTGLAGCRQADGGYGHFESPGDYVPPELAEQLGRNLLWRVGAPAR